MSAEGQLRVESIGQVERDLAELWRAASSADAAVMRACMMNLVVYCEDDTDLSAVSVEIARLSEQVPGRALVVCPGDGEGDDLDVFVNAHCHQRSDGKQVCSEQVSFRPRGTGRELIPGTLRGLLVGDCPVDVWWRRSRLAGDPLLEPLAEMADRFVAHPGEVERPAAFLATLNGIRRETRPLAIGDVTWVRSEPWRDLVASLFDFPSTRPLLSRLTSLEVRGGGNPTPRGVTVAAAYLAGWIAARLGWQPGRDADGTWLAGDRTVRVTCVPDEDAAPGEIVAVRLDAATDQGTATLRAERVEGAPHMVRSWIEHPGTCGVPWMRKLEPMDDLALFCGHLQRRESDALFLGALAAAATIAGPPR